MRSRQQSPPARLVPTLAVDVFARIVSTWLERLFFCFLALLLASKLTIAELTLVSHYKTCAGEATPRSSHK
jgi:hypothetical protein